MRKILLTGGSGCLGKQLLKLYPNFYAPSHKSLDIVSKKSIKKYFISKKIDLIVHCAAYTNVVKAEQEKKLCYEINVLGTRNLAQLGIPMIYISTEYVFDGEKGNYSEKDIPNPQNFYGLTKLLGEYEAKKTKTIIIRTLLKPKPFEYNVAFIDQITSGDYADIIAKEILLVIKKWNFFKSEIINIGTGKKSIFELASRTKKVIPTTIETEKIGIKIPKNIFLNLTKWKKFKQTIK